MKINNLSKLYSVLKLRNLILFICIVKCINFCYGCDNSGNTIGTTSKSIAKDTVLKGTFNPSSGIVFDSTAVDRFLKSKPAFKEFEKDFRKFYQLRKYNFVWYDKKGLIESANNLFAQLEYQQNEGILKHIPYKAQYDSLISKYTNSTSHPSPDINLELMLTGQYFNYAKNVWAGSQNEKASTIGWYLPRKKLSYSELLEKNISGKDTTVGQKAVIPQYNALKQALSKYRRFENEADQKIILSDSLKKIRPGGTLPAIAKLRKRLVQLGNLEADNHSMVYDDVLQKGIFDFKETHGLTRNDIIDRTFIAELNVPIKKRIGQIIVNLERMRWIPTENHGDEFILINIPAYLLHYYEKDKIVWGCNVVVGKAMTKTEIFSGEMKYVILSPYWNVPKSIVNKEIIPGIRKNPNYLADHRMESFNGGYRQKPGPNNSLGLVKFIFPNSSNIYLHDTPSKSLFSEDARAFSHGCVRVEKPRDLAIRILRQKPEWTPAKLDAGMHSGVETTITLTKKIPVYIGYFTAFVDPEGKLNFRNDIYSRDARLLSMLMKN